MFYIIKRFGKSPCVTSLPPSRGEKVLGEYATSGEAWSALERYILDDIDRKDIFAVVCFFASLAIMSTIAGHFL